jgi:hypothetical protein
MFAWFAAIYLVLCILNPTLGLTEDHHQATDVSDDAAEFIVGGRKVWKIFF